jgi:hypothetical protein
MAPRYKSYRLSGTSVCTAYVGIAPARAQSVRALNREVEDLQNQLSEADLTRA